MSDSCSVAEGRQSEFATSVMEGLAKVQKSLPSKFFYDREGSKLFDRICDLPEYYITRTEASILEERAPTLVNWVGDRPVILELGSGASRKTRTLLMALSSAVAYVPIDISLEILNESSSQLATLYPKLKILPICADFADFVNVPWHELPANRGRNVVFFPGSTLGNFDWVEACCLLKNVAQLVGPGGLLLLGVDLVKSPEILKAAYNDAQGITAEFNLNILKRMKSELGAQLDLSGFVHHAFFNENKSRIEMHLMSRRRQKIAVLGAEFCIGAGETIHTENSQKYTVEMLTALGLRAGFQRLSLWTDSQRFFAVALFSLPRLGRVMRTG